MRSLFKSDRDNNVFTGGNRRERRANTSFKDEIVRLDLSKESFPELVSSTISSDTIKLNFLSDKVKTNVVNESTINLNENIPDGWVLLAKKVTSPFDVNEYDSSTNIGSSSNIGSSTNIGSNGMKSLINLFEKRKEEYIKAWGEEEYFYMFKFPNYDYDYFSKLDELEEIYDKRTYNHDITDNYDYEGASDFDYEENYY